MRQAVIGVVCLAAMGTSCAKPGVLKLSGQDYLRNLQVSSNGDILWFDRLNGETETRKIFLWNPQEFGSVPQELYFDNMGWNGGGFKLTADENALLVWEKNSLRVLDASLGKERQHWKLPEDAGVIRWVVGNEIVAYVVTDTQQVWRFDNTHSRGLKLWSWLDASQDEPDTVARAPDAIEALHLTTDYLVLGGDGRYAVLDTASQTLVGVCKTDKPYGGMSALSPDGSTLYFSQGHTPSHTSATTYWGLYACELATQTVTLHDAKPHIDPKRGARLAAVDPASGDVWLLSFTNDLHQFSPTAGGWSAAGEAPEGLLGVRAFNGGLWWIEGDSKYSHGQGHTMTDLVLRRTSPL